MKKTRLASCIFFSALPCFAGMGLVQTNFWQAPYPTDYKIVIKSSSQDLAKSCQQLDKVAWNAEGTSQVWKADQMARLRTAALPSQDEETFQTDFKITNMRGFNLLSEAQTKELSELVAVAASVDTISNFSQLPSEIILRAFEFSKLTFAFKPKSLTQVSESFGLEPIPISVLENEDGPYLRIFSKDVACDLILHRLALSTKSSAVIKISLEQQIQLSDFYAKVESISKSIIASRKNPISRAALLGFRLGGFLSSKAQTPPMKAEGELVAIMDKFFDVEKMAPNSRWTESNGEKFLSVPGQTQAMAVQINISAD